MLFNSFSFIFGFLPIFYFLYYFLQSRKLYILSLFWVLFASLFFYAWWNPLYLPLLLVSIFINYILGILMLHDYGDRRFLLSIGIIFNLSLLGYYKYIGFISENIGLVFGQEWKVDVILPLAISFFTFQQIAFLVDSYRRRLRHTGPLEYAVFVSFFPQLIAGPIVHHSEMMPQFANWKRRVTWSTRALAISLFTFGLFKKTVIADGLAPIANTVFARAEEQASLSVIDATLGALSYTLQLYYDFSGYSEMAIGLALFIGIKLPVNFFSPYKAASIIDFWRRWHITLSRFLRDYLYIPLGGNRKGKIRRYINLMITMLLGGLWHGAGWTFLIWGGYHGMLLMLNHAWRSFCERFHVPALPRPLAVAITFFLVMVGWIFFRADSMAAATYMLQAIFMSSDWGLNLEAIRALLKSGNESLGFVVMLLLGGLVAVFFLPNTVRWHFGAEGREAGFKPNWLSLMLVILMWAIILYKAGGANEFLYFQF